MKQSPRTGLTGELSVTVGPDNRISFADERMPAVLATPWLVAYLEYAARDAIAPLLDANERSVGTFIEVEHLGPAPEGFTVKCRAGSFTSPARPSPSRSRPTTGLKQLPRASIVAA